MSAMSVFSIEGPIIAERIITNRLEWGTFEKVNEEE